MKQKLIGIALVLGLIGLGGYKYYEYKHPSVKTVNTVTAQKAESNNEVSVTPIVSDQSSSININVGTPVNGVRKGVIEVGASGFNSFVVNMDKDKNWEIVDKQFGESLAYEGFANVEDVKIGINKYLSQIFNKGVKGSNAHFVMSSGALKNPKTELIAKGIEAKGYVVNRVTPEQEGKYALRALLPKTYRNSAYVVDIGSGNTKISWYEGENLKSVELPGAKYFQNNLSDDQVYTQIKTASAKVPSQVRKTCFIIGGVPYTLAKQVRNAEDRFTLLKNPDFYSAGEDIKIKSGLNIYRAIQESLGTEQFIFDWDANFTIGFLLTLN